MYTTCICFCIYPYVQWISIVCTFVIATSDSSLYSMWFGFSFISSLLVIWRSTVGLYNHQLITSGKMINSQDWWKETTIILKWSFDILSLGIKTENSEILLIRLLMDEFLHHLKGKNVKNEIKYQPQLVSWISSIYSIVYLHSKEIIPTHLFFHPMLPPCLEAPLHHWSTGRPFQKKRGRIFIRSEYLVAPTANNKKW